jgi:hypothetical protein
VKIVEILIRKRMQMKVGIGGAKVLKILKNVK